MEKIEKGAQMDGKKPDYDTKALKRAFKRVYCQPEEICSEYPLCVSSGKCLKLGICLEIERRLIW